MKNACRNAIFQALIVFLFIAVSTASAPAEPVLVELSEPEQQWLNQHPVVRVAPDPDYPPIESLDENGNLLGISADYLKLLEERLGIEFQIVPVASWDDAMKMARDREVDMLSAATNTAARSEFMSFTMPHIELPGVIIAQSGSKKFKSLRALRGKSVGVVSSYVWQEWIVRDHPGIDLQPVRDMETGLLLVSFGRLDAMVGNLATATHTLRSLGISNLQVSGKTDYFARLAFATRNDWPELNSILRKAVSTISLEESQEILDRWIPLANSSWLERQTLLLGLLVLIALVLLAVGGNYAWNSSLRRELRRQDKSLRTSEEHLRDAIERIPDGFILYDAEGNFVVCNERHRVIYPEYAEHLKPGASRTSLLHAYFEYRPESVRSEYDENWLAERLAFVNEPRPAFDRQLPDGHWIRVSEHRTGSGGIVGLRSDITDLKLREHALSESEQTLRKILEKSPIGVAIVNHTRGKQRAEAKRLFVNDALVAMLGGVSRDQMLNSDISGTWVGLDQLVEVNETIKSGADLEDFEAQRLRLDGTEIWISMNTRPIRFDNADCTMVWHFDITERKAAEQALRESEAQLRLVTDSLPVLIAYIDADERYQFVSKTTQEWFSKDWSEIIGKTVSEIYPVAYARFKPHINKVLAGENVSFEDTVIYGDNSNRTIWASYVPHFSENQDVLGYFALVEDITERKETEAQLRQAQKMEVVGQLTGGVAHDFNNLLGIIIGNLDFLLESATTDERQKKLIGSSLRAALNGADLTSRLLAFSRTQQLQPEFTNLTAQIEGMSELLERVLEETISLKTNLPPDIGDVEVDQAQLETALLNLAVNARHAMPDGGRLTIEASNVVLDAEYLKNFPALSPGDYVMIAVSDTGTGMSAATLDKVFDPFFTTKEIGEGSGLGLSMVHGFVNQSGGYVSIYSEEGVGTTVKLYFPRATDVWIVEPKGPEPKDRKLGDGETILVVEDDDDLRELAVKIVLSLGYKVLEAEDGPAALRVLEENRQIDLLFSDVVLPHGMNGAELAKKAHKNWPDLKVLFASGYTGSAIEGKGILESGFELVAKPYRRAELAEQLQTALKPTLAIVDEPVSSKNVG